MWRRECTGRVKRLSIDTMSKTADIPLQSAEIKEVDLRRTSIERILKTFVVINFIFVNTSSLPNGSADLGRVLI